MANNDWTEAIPKLLAMGLQCLRENAITASLVNRNYENIAASDGDTVTIPIPQAVATNAVSPSHVYTEPQSLTPTKVTIPLDQWREAKFRFTDKEQMEVYDGIFPLEAKEAVKALANELDVYVLALASKFYGYVGATTGTIIEPFYDGTNYQTFDAASCRTTLNNQLAPLGPRYMLLNPDAEGNALNCRPFLDSSFGGGPEAIRNGDLTTKLGFSWLMNQNMQTHTAGAGITGDPDTTAENLAGVKTINITTDADDAVGVLTGDIIKFANHSQTYVATGDLTMSASDTDDLLIEPGLAVTVPIDTTFTVASSHVMNLAFHPNAIALVNRPLAGSRHPGAQVFPAFDDVSGLSLRLEVSRQNKQDQFSWDLLYGANVIRRELGVRLAGVI